MRTYARKMCKEFSGCNPEDNKKRTQILKELFGSTGNSIYMGQLLDVIMVKIFI